MELQPTGKNNRQTRVLFANNLEALSLQSLLVKTNVWYSDRESQLLNFRQMLKTADHIDCIHRVLTKDIYPAPIELPTKIIDRLGVMLVTEQQTVVEGWLADVQVGVASQYETPLPAELLDLATARQNVVAALTAQIE